ncbi:MAG: hypothetical protein IT293_00185 [Deltaproteobacteria bacterium]|nr:hypothetical protein [Deltaproteobacteria bacterium]
MTAGAAWDRCRYGRLLPLAARDPHWGGAYAAFVAAVEWRRDPGRRAAATDRIARWLAATSADAGRIHRASLASEAREEADAAFFMRRPDALAAAFGARPLPLAPEDGPVVYVGLHLGSPVLGYLDLCRRLAPELALVARGIDPANPMAAAKRRFAERKVAWTEVTAGRPFFATDGASMLGVRRHLRAGKPLYLLADVPGDAVGRAAACTLFGERVRLAAGLPTLARIADSAVQTLAITRDARGFAVHAGPRVPAGAVDMPVVLDALAPFVRAHPEQWWMWPYLPAAGAVDSSER